MMPWCWCWVSSQEEGNLCYSGVREALSPNEASWGSMRLSTSVNHAVTAITDGTPDCLPTVLLANSLSTECAEKRLPDQERREMSMHFGNCNGSH